MGRANQVKFEYVKWPRYGTINYELRSPISYEIVKKHGVKVTMMSLRAEGRPPIPELK